jgi:hypothetical protein
MRVIVEELVEWRLAGETEVLEKTCPSATLSTTNPTWPDPGSNLGCSGGKPVTNRLSYGATNIIYIYIYIYIYVCVCVCVCVCKNVDKSNY